MVAPGAVVFSSTDTVSEPSLATMRSGWPSPLRSATATEIGIAAGGEGLLGGEGGAVAPGAVVFSSTDTVVEP